ncbi:hypothetical protein [Dichotomicrobium thermohalophilum]|uniref:hypothetical protein n=1 Tax=Dichotomicrobium thermohalophilum TaxID=933063 RepID=UPI0011C21884|nr:hypothetical protein [Dichotomicrobium thermohalophilum]
MSTLFKSCILSLLMILPYAHVAAEPLFLDCQVKTIWSSKNGKFRYGEGISDIFVLEMQGRDLIHLDTPNNCEDGEEKIEVSETEIFYRCKQNYSDKTIVSSYIINRVNGDYFASKAHVNGSAKAFMGSCSKKE